LAPGDLPTKPGVLPVVQISSEGHTMVAFVNGDFIGKDIKLKKNIS